MRPPARPTLAPLLCSHSVLLCCSRGCSLNIVLICWPGGGPGEVAALIVEQRVSNVLLILIILASSILCPPPACTPSSHTQARDAGAKGASACQICKTSFNASVKLRGSRNFSLKQAVPRFYVRGYANVSLYVHNCVCERVY